MALTDEGGMNTTMLVSPTGGYGNNGGFGGFGDNGWWIILLLLLAGGWGNGNGGGFGGGYGNMMLGYDFPWLLNGQNGINNNVSSGFRDAQLNDGITSIRDGINALQTQLCGCCSDTQMALANGFAGVEQGANARQMANMQSMFNIQSALQECCCENRAATADLKYTVATENCADRTQSMQNTRDIIENQTRSTQLILDKLCQQELDALKSQNLALQNQVNMATLRESQTAQTAQIQNNIVSELRSCPIPSMPVYGNQAIFTCPQNQNSGCGCGCGA